jgi:hypothetical protein
VHGKVDWLAFGLPREGGAVLAGDVMRREVAVCELDAALEAARRQLETGAAICVVVNEARTRTAGRSAWRWLS